MDVGKRVIDIGPVLSVFEAQEGEVQHIIGKTGMGKTYEATRRARLFLLEGYTVYTTWRLNLPEYYDERESFWPVLRNLILFRKTFYRFNLRENWKFVDLRDYESKSIYQKIVEGKDEKDKRKKKKEILTEEVLPKYADKIKELEENGYTLKEQGGVIDSEALARFLASRTDCIFMLDEGQDVFDSHKKAGQIARQSITRTRHMHKTLIIISQRAQAVDVTARGNVTYFYKCEKRNFPFLPPYFKVYRTDEIDENSNYPLWSRSNSVGELTWQAPVWYAAFAKKKIYDAYDSWYMRQNMIKSQDLSIEAYTLTPRDKFKLLFKRVDKKKKGV